MAPNRPAIRQLGCRAPVGPAPRGQVDEREYIAFAAPVLLARLARPAAGEGEEDGIPDIQGLVLDLGAESADIPGAFVSGDGGVLYKPAEEAFLQQEILHETC